jgi:hypothetical protein
MRFLALLLACSFAAFAQEENLIKNGSFEEPAVKARTTTSDGGNPSRTEEGKSSWTQFMAPLRPRDLPGGDLLVGMTNEFAHTGKQSIFVDFQKVTAQRGSFLVSDLLPVKGGQRYRIALWGRIDAKRPIALDQRRPMLKLEFEYFTTDPETQTGPSDFGTQMIPGRLDRMIFVSNKWSEYFRTVRTPGDAAFMKVTFRWETVKEAGETDGAIYFDDVSATAVAGGESLAPLDPNAPKPPVPDADTDEEKEKEKQ